jgi:hypothetical protein
MTRAGAVAATLKEWNEYFATNFINAVLCEETTRESWVRYAVYFFDYRIGDISEALRIIPSNIVKLVPLQHPPPWDDLYRERWTFSRKEPEYESSSSSRSTRSTHSIRNRKQDSKESRPHNYINPSTLENNTSAPGPSVLTIEWSKSPDKLETMNRPRTPDPDAESSKAVAVSSESLRKERERSRSS